MADTVNSSGWFHLFSFEGAVFSATSFAAFCLLYLLTTSIYNVFLHPLKHLPGPLSARASILPSVFALRTGNIVNWIKDQHDKYGDVVRVSPTEVSFTSAETAWPDIYGFRTGKYKGTGPYLKDTKFYNTVPNEVHHIVTAGEEDHTRMRRNLSHAFSDKALRSQEPLIQSFVDLLISRIGEHAVQGKSIDITRWYNYATFDIISDLAFGAPLDCLRGSRTHTVNLVMGFVKAGMVLSTRDRFPPLKIYDRLVKFFTTTSSALTQRMDFFHLTTSQVGKRLDRGIADDRNDFFTAILKHQEKETQRLSREEMDSNAIVLLVAGSETTATTLSGTTFLLLQHPTVYHKLVAEIRTAFTSAAEITLDAVNHLEYLLACLQEGLRIYPPAPTGLPRVVPAGGDCISGHYIAGGTSVYVSQHATNHSAQNFRDPDAYVPERWLGDERYQHDKREVVNPFSFGPRNCLGKNLAYAEMRLILAKLLFTYDLELVDRTRNWMDTQKVYVLWDKPGLEVKVTRAVRT